MKIFGGSAKLLLIIPLTPVSSPQLNLPLIDLIISKKAMLKILAKLQAKLPGNGIGKTQYPTNTKMGYR